MEVTMIPLKDQSLLKTELFIDGQWVDANSGNKFPVTNPATGEVLAEVCDADKSDAEGAVAAAVHAFEKWRHTLPNERAQILRRIAELIKMHREDLAQLITYEQGKPLTESRGEIDYAHSFFEWFAEEARRIYGRIIPPHFSDGRNLVIHQPVGVAAAITPWNFPVAMVAKKLPAALAAGCTFLWKPAEDTPLSGLALAEICCRGGLPAGVLNVLPTANPAKVGEVFTTDSRIQKISFTGSTEVGKLILRQSAIQVKKVSLELGGNAPFIIFDDADIEKAVEGVIASKFRNAGQTCVCANRIFVQDGIYEKFAEALVSAVKSLKVGYGWDQGVKIGPLINGDAVKKVRGLVQDAIEKGAQVKLGGQVKPDNEHFFLPTVLTEVSETAKMAQNEIFGPVAPLYRFTEEKEVIEKANNTQYGLASYFYARDIGRIWRVSEELAYGMVGVNTGMISTAVAPFGGVKQSGIGREGGTEGIEEYLETKFICQGGINR
jgi:succinate-semialdehyde dehydrogenase/glutarate-semialdehyde dehydrogenase